MHIIDKIKRIMNIFNSSAFAYLFLQRISTWGKGQVDSKNQQGDSSKQTDQSEKKNNLF